MEIKKPLNREEVIRNCKRTLILLRSNKPEAADLMLNMLNETILKRYGESKQAIDVSKFSKLNSEKRDDNDTKVQNKKPKLKNIKKETSHKIIKNEDKLNELSNDVKIQDQCQKTKHKSNKLNNKISRHNKSKTNIVKDEEHLMNINKCFEKYYHFLDEYDERTKSNTSQTLTTIKRMNNNEKSNSFTKNNGNNENSNGTINQESKIYETQNTENPHPNNKNESLGMSPTVKRALLQTKSTAKVRSHKKTPLHELSSRQRIQAVLEKRVNNK